MDRFIRVTLAAVRTMLVVLVAGILGLMLLEVVSRRIFGHPTLFVYEVSTYFFVAVVYLGFADALEKGAHIGVDLIVKKLPPRWQFLLQTIALTLALVYVGVFTGFAIKLVRDSLMRGTTSASPLGTPLFIPQLAIPVGTTLFFGMLLLTLLRSVNSRRSSRAKIKPNSQVNRREA